MQNTDLSYSPYSLGDGLEMADPMGYPFPSPAPSDSLCWPYVLDSQPQLTVHGNNSPQHQRSLTWNGQTATRFDLTSNPCGCTPPMQQNFTNGQGYSRGSSDWGHSWGESAMSIASVHTPQLLATDLLNWHTPEQEPTSLKDIDVWLSLNDPQLRSPSLTPSSGSTTTLKNHQRTPSSSSVHQSAPFAEVKEKPRCWEHGCNGRQFSTVGNLVRHCREKSEQRPQRKCPRCGALFSRTTARNQHLAKNACNRIRRYSNGRQRPDWMTRVTDDE